MITALRGEDLAQRIREILPSAVQECGKTEVWVSPESVLDVCRHLAKTPGLEFNMLNSISAVDYVDHFEVVYHVTSTVNMLSAVVKTRVYGRENPIIAFSYQRMARGRLSRTRNLGPDGRGF